MGSVLCEHCPGQCCRYVALPLEDPTTRRDFDDMRWYLMHAGVVIFVEDDEWYIQFTAPCRNLQADNRCGVYETRPTICREYSTNECEYNPGDYDYDYLFTEPEQLEAFAKKQLRPKQAKASKKPKAKRRPRKGGRPSPTGDNGIVPLRLPKSAAS